MPDKEYSQLGAQNTGINMGWRNQGFNGGGPNAGIIESDPYTRIEVSGSRFAPLTTVMPVADWKPDRDAQKHMEKAREELAKGKMDKVDEYKGGTKWVSPLASNTL